MAELTQNAALALFAATLKKKLAVKVEVKVFAQ
jgi:hypothetical protein